MQGASRPSRAGTARLHKAQDLVGNKLSCRFHAPDRGVSAERSGRCARNIQHPARRPFAIRPARAAMR